MNEDLILDTLFSAYVDDAFKNMSVIALRQSDKRNKELELFENEVGMNAEQCNKLEGLMLDEAYIAEKTGFKGGLLVGAALARFLQANANGRKENKNT